MRERYGASVSSSAKAEVPRADLAVARLHAQEMDFNDIRTTLQAL